MHTCTLRAGGKFDDWIEECRGRLSQWHKHTQPGQAHDDHLQLHLATEE